MTENQWMLLQQRLWIPRVNSAPPCLFVLCFYACQCRNRRMSIQAITSSSGLLWGPCPFMHVFIPEWTTYLSEIQPLCRPGALTAGTVPHVHTAWQQMSNDHKITVSGPVETWTNIWPKQGCPRALCMKTLTISHRDEVSMPGWLHLAINMRIHLYLQLRYL